MKFFLFLFSFLFVLSCKTTRTANVAAYGGKFANETTISSVQKPVAELIVSTEKVTCQTLPQASATLPAPPIASSNLQKNPLANSVRKTVKADLATSPEPTNKNIRIGTKLFVAGTIGLVLFSILAIMLTAPIATFMYPLIWLGVATILTGVTFGYIGSRQLRRNNGTEKGELRGKISRGLFWAFAAILAFVAITAAYVIIFDPTGGE